MKKYLQKIVTVMSALALALVAFPSGVYADVAPEPPIPGGGSGGAVGIVVVILVIVVVAASILILKKIKKK